MDSTVVLRCVLFVVVLCACWQVLDAKKQHTRRRDVHRIVLKTKNKGSRYKKPHSHPEYYQYHIQDDVSYDPYLDHSPEASHQYESFDEAPYASPHQYNRFRDHERYKERPHYQTRKPYKQYDFDGYKTPQEYDPYKHQTHSGDYRNYRDMMEEYNRKQEDDFRRQVEKSKAQMQYTMQPAHQQPTYQQPTHQQPTHQQPTYQQPTHQQATHQQPVYQQSNYQQPTYQQPVHQQPTQEAYHFSESQTRPVWNAHATNDFRGEWNPISQSESQHNNPSNSYTNHVPSYDNSYSNHIPTYESTSTTSQSNYQQYSVELTTSKPQKMPSIIIEKNMTKGHKQKTVNYNFNRDYFPNHKPSNNPYQSSPKDQNQYDVKEPNSEASSQPVSYQNSAIVSSSYSTLWAGNSGNETEVSEVGGQSGGKGHFGTRTKVRRTKRPAYAAQ